MDEKKRVTAEELIVAWQSSSTLQEAADKLGMTPVRTCARAVYYRSIGVPLKKLTRGRKPLDRGSLKRLAEESLPKPDQPAS